MILCDVPSAPAPRRQVHPRAAVEIDAGPDCDPSPIGTLEAGHEPQQRRLASPALADDDERFVVGDAGLEREGERVEALSDREVEQEPLRPPLPRVRTATPGEW